MNTKERIPRLLEAPNRSFFLFGPRGTGKSTWLQESLPEAFTIMRMKGLMILMAAGMIAGLCFVETGIAQGTFKNPSPALSHDWKRLDDGLYFGEFEAPQKSPVCEYPITVLKIDPNVYHLKLVSASEHGGKSKTAKEWADAFRLVAAINASMYNEDHRTSTGYMKNFTHVNNSRINTKFGAFLAFNPLSPSLPPVQIIDRYEQDWEALIQNYHTVIQNYRMISLKGGNMWKPSESIYSIAAVAMDTNGNVLFIHSRSPYSVHDFNPILLKLPLNIKNAMYVEGGPEATLYVSAGGKERAWVGSYETRFSEHDDNAMLWRVPNIIGITRRE